MKQKASPPPMTAVEAAAERLERLELRASIAALLRKLLCVALALWFALSVVFGLNVVRGEGMYPRFRDGDAVIFYRLEREYHIGDVLCYSAQGETRYGRVVALGGDRVDVSDDGQLIVNDGVQQEEVFFPTYKEGRAQELPVTLGQDELFLLGDNRTAARDSRDSGPVPLTDIQGKVITLLRRRGL